MISGTNIYWTFAISLGILPSVKDEVGGFHFALLHHTGDGLILRRSLAGIGRLISTSVGVHEAAVLAIAEHTRQADFCRNRRGLIFRAAHTGVGAGDRLPFPVFCANV